MIYNFIDRGFLHDNLVEGVSEEELYKQVREEIEKAKRTIAEQEKKQREADIAASRMEVAKAALHWLVTLKLIKDFSDEEVEFVINELKKTEKDLSALGFILNTVPATKRASVNTDDDIIKKFLDNL